MHQYPYIPWALDFRKLASAWSHDNGVIPADRLARVAGLVISCSVVFPHAIAFLHGAFALLRQVALDRSWSTAVVKMDPPTVADIDRLLSLPSVWFTSDASRSAAGAQIGGAIYSEEEPRPRLLGP